MDMRLIKESIQLEQPAARGRSQTVVEGEIALPGGLREEARVLHAGGMVVVDNVEAMQDRAAVTGKVVFHALYSQGDHSKVSALEATADFSHMMDLPGVQPRSNCRVEGVVEHVDASAAGGRLSLKAVVRLDGQGMVSQPVEAVTGVHGLEGVETRSQAITVKRTVATGSEEMLLREEFALPQELHIRETLYATAVPQVQEVTGGLGRCGLSGQVYLEAVHACDLPGKPVTVTRHTLPFSQVLDLTGDEGEMLSGHGVIRDVAVASQETAEGERTLRAEVLLGLRAEADRKENITLLQDAYTTSGDDLRLAAKELRCRVEDTAFTAAESGKTMLMLPEGSAPVRSVLCAFATPLVTGREQLGGRLTVEGVLEVDLIYMTDDSDEPRAVSQEEPFRMTFAAQAGTEDHLRLRCSEVEANAITSDRVEMKYIMTMDVSGVQTQQARLVTDALPVAAAAPEGSIVLYFTQPDETMWDIAKRYRVPVRELKELNPEAGEELAPGQGVVVWRRA